MINKLLIVGCGLIGSSILKKVFKKKIAKKIFVFEKSKKNQRTLKRFKLKFQLIKKKFSEINNVSISKKYFEYVIKGMERAIEGINGTAKKSRITNLKICGKTGTVENYKKRIKQKEKDDEVRQVVRDVNELRNEMREIKNLLVVVHHAY